MKIEANPGGLLGDEKESDPPAQMVFIYIRRPHGIHK
jgi:hypothetical protein